MNSNLTTQITKKPSFALGDKVCNVHGKLLGKIEKLGDFTAVVQADHLPKESRPMGMFHPRYIMRIESLVAAEKFRYVENKK